MLYRTDKMTKAQREHFGYLMDVLSQLEWDLHQPIVAKGRIPHAWHEIANTRYPKKKQKVTMWVEEDVVRFFKKMGRGYPPVRPAQRRARATQQDAVCPFLTPYICLKDRESQIMPFGNPESNQDERALSI